MTFSPNGWTPDPDEAGRIGPYRVVIIRNSDGERREIAEDLWHSSSLFWWTEGNGACDCNRHLWFERWVNPDYDADVPCGNDAYYVECAIFPNGDRVQIDDPPVKK